MPQTYSQREYEHRQKIRRFSLGVTIGIFLLAIFICAYFVFNGSSSRRDEAGIITNAPISSVSASEQSSSVPESTQNIASDAQVSDSPSPKVDTAQASDRLEECVNKATDTSLDAVQSLAGECFYNYTYHLPNLYGLKHYKDLKIDDLKTIDEQTAKISATIEDESGHGIGTIQGFWVERHNQFKITDVTINDAVSQYISQTVISEAGLAQ